MDAEDFYESQRLKEEEMADKFDERKAHEMAFYAKEITELFEACFDGCINYRAARLPRVRAARMAGDPDCVVYDAPFADVIADLLSLDGLPLAELLSACGMASPNLDAFKAACLKLYLEQHLDDLAECEIERQDGEGME